MAELENGMQKKDTDTSPVTEETSNIEEYTEKEEGAETGQIEETGDAPEEKQVSAAESRSSQKNGKPKAYKKGFFKKHRKLITVCIILVLIMLLFSFYSRVSKVKDELNAAAVTEQRDVKRKDLRRYITVTSTIEPNDKRTVSTLVSNTRVLEVNCKIGDYVHAGDVICTFDTTRLSENMARLEKKMNVTTQKQNILMNDTQVDVNKAGTTWAYDTQDDLTAAARKQTDYDRAVAEYYNAADGYSNAKKEKDSKGSARDAAKRDYDNAKAAYDTLTDQEKAGAVELDDAKTAIKKTYEYYKGLYEAAETAYKAAASSVETFESNIKSKEGAMITAKNALEDATIKTPRDYVKDYVDVQLAQEKRYTAGLDASIANDENMKAMSDYEKELESSIVRAPISGLVTSLNVHPGDEFADRSKSEICVIQDDTGYIAKGNVNQYDIGNVTQGMRAVIKTDTTGKDELDGTVTFVSPVPSSSQSSPGTGSSDTGKTKVQFPVEVKLNIRDSRLRIGVTAETSLILEEKKDALCVPYDCIETDDYGNKYVYVVGKEETTAKETEKKGLSDKLAGLFAGSVPEEVKTRKVKVETGIETDYYIEILSPEIKEGDRVTVPSSSDKDPFAADPASLPEGSEGAGSGESREPEEGEPSPEGSTETETDLTAGAGGL